MSHAEVIQGLPGLSTVDLDLRVYREGHLQSPSLTVNESTDGAISQYRITGLPVETGAHFELTASIGAGQTVRRSWGQPRLPPRQVVMPLRRSGVLLTDVGLRMWADGVEVTPLSLSWAASGSPADYVIGNLPEMSAGVRYVLTYVDGPMSGEIILVLEALEALSGDSGFHGFIVGVEDHIAAQWPASSSYTVRDGETSAVPTFNRGLSWVQPGTEGSWLYLDVIWTFRERLGAVGSASYRAEGILQHTIVVPELGGRSAYAQLADRVEPMWATHAISGLKIRAAQPPREVPGLAPRGHMAVQVDVPFAWSWSA